MACLGAAAMVVLGIITLSDAAVALSGSLNVLGFFLGLMVVAAVAESAGLVEAVTQRAAAWSGGSGRRLLLIVFGVGVVTTSLLSNDATALMLTPVVFLLARRLSLDPLPYVFACAFIANAASFLLPVANPVNLLAVDAFDLRLGDYLVHLLLPGLVVIGATAAIFLFIFRRETGRTFAVPAPPPPGRPMLRLVIVVLFGIVAGYVIFSLNGWPLSLPVLAGAAVLLTMGSMGSRLKWPELARSVSWSILPFVAALAVLVKGLEAGGATAALAGLYDGLLGNGGLAAGLATSFSTAAASNVMNNWPAMMVSVTTLSGAPEAVAQNPGLPYQAILGAALGPNIAVMGSLSSMLWLVLLRRRGLFVSAGAFFRLGMLVTPAALLLGSLTLYLLS
ncbi:arsenite efflux membrane protein ArsB [Dehalogenimonas alkenigignens]|uniref:Arsenite efflux membrane protein ArsB n=2 Tax=Dehalogenimonas alkenigignens TaxID=1217799 RepID=A0A0W0GIP1_9CHLR|nr:arsenite efflux membrane protein ArsB [Dehalogenimonas alkenigignens]